MHSHEYYMHRCLELAKLGIGTVAPNPMVGAVIVLDGKIIGEGFHEIYGGPHAEVNAINSVKDPSVLKDATIYVSLEPCSHHGKTPPCADLLVKHQFQKVVIACQDTFSEVSGNGIKRLQQAGIEVEFGILEKEARLLNKRFFTFHEEHRPYVILKWAQSRNGYIDIQRNENHSGIHWITQPETKKLVHKWRSEEMAILVGKNTVLNDNPSLTVREWTGSHPIRIVLDSNLEIPADRTVFNEEVPTIVFNTQKQAVENNIQFIQLKKIEPQHLLEVLFQLNIQSVIIEGGATVLQSFIDHNLWDEARVLTGIYSIENGVDAPQISGQIFDSLTFGRDSIKFIARA